MCVSQQEHKSWNLAAGIPDPSYAPSSPQWAPVYEDATRHWCRGCPGLRGVCVPATAFMSCAHSVIASLSILVTISFQKGDSSRVLHTLHATCITSVNSQTDPWIVENLVDA